MRAFVIALSVAVAICIGLYALRVPKVPALQKDGADPDRSVERSPRVASSFDGEGPPQEHNPTTSPPAFSHGGEIEEDPDPEMTAIRVGSGDRLSSVQRGQLLEALAKAEHASAESLVRDVLAHIHDTSGRDLEFSAWMLAWSLAKDARGLVEIDRAMLENRAHEDIVRALVLIVGGTGTAEARDWLLRRLQDKAMAQYEETLIDALNQSTVADMDVLSFQFGNYLSEGSNQWTPGYPGSISVSTDPLVVDAMLRRVVEPTSEAVQRKAASMLEELSHPKRVHQVANETRSTIQATFLRFLRESDDARILQSAVAYLKSTVSSDVSTAMWDRFSRESPQSVVRRILAGPLAHQVQSTADVYRMIQVARGDSDVVVREAMVLGLTSYVKGALSDRLAIAESIAGWARADPSERVRLDAVQVLAHLLPDTAHQLEWARNDSSAAVRAKAEQVLQESAARTPH